MRVQLVREGPDLEAMETMGPLPVVDRVEVASLDREMAPAAVRRRPSFREADNRAVHLVVVVVVEVEEALEVLRVFPAAQEV